MINFKPPVSPFTIEHLSNSIRTGQLLPSELTGFCLGQIKNFNHVLNSFITVRSEEEIFEIAERCDKLVKQNDLLDPLHGIPYSIKDMIHAKHLKFTAGSKFYSDYVSNTTASIVKILNKKGAILIGTNNLNEFASGITGKNSIFGDSKNPWDLSRASGGSSGGSTVAVASGMVVFSLGTDTGGSVRVPASLCGLVGMKPTFGLISTSGVFPLSSSLDHMGWLTRSVWDSNLIFKSLCNDINCKKVKKNTLLTPKPLRASKLVIGIPNGYFLRVIDSRIKEVFINFLQIISQSPILVKNFDIKYANNFFSSWKKVRLYEASRIHADILESNTGQIGSDVMKMLFEGTYITMDDYILAKKQIKKIKHEFMKFFSGINAILVPTTVILAPKLREIDIKIDGLQLNVRRALLRNTVLFNSIGLPAITIPIGFVNEKGIILPVGLQIIGPQYGDHMVLFVAQKMEELVGSNSLLNPIISKEV